MSEMGTPPKNRLLVTMRIFCSILLALLSFSLSPLYGQTAESDTAEVAMPIKLRVQKAYYRGDSIPHITLSTIYKYPELRFKNQRERDNYNRLVRNVKKVLPLAKMVRMTIIETYEYLETLPNEEARREHISAVERGLKRDYTPMLKKMSRSQGRLLIKLVDRECNMSGYNIAQAFIGSFRANFYQGIGFIFGLNLNKKYDPEGDDRYTERVVRLVESGQI